MENINWKPLKENKRYLISNTGLVKSIITAGSGGRVKCPNGLRRQIRGRIGYYVVSLPINGKYKTLYVHRLVASLFVPNPEGLREVNHLDGNKLNNHYSNLEWCTHRQNITHAHRIGLFPPLKHDVFTNAKLTHSQVLVVYQLCDVMSQRKVAQLFNISQSNVSAIRSGKTWKDLIKKVV